MMSPLVETQATGKEIEALVDNILHVLNGEERGKGVMACFTLALLLLKDNVTADEIQGGVYGLSQWACAFLAGNPVEGVGKAN